jgi:hypothetical protein
MKMTGWLIGGDLDYHIGTENFIQGKKNSIKVYLRHVSQGDTLPLIYIPTPKRTYLLISKKAQTKKSEDSQNLIWATGKKKEKKRKPI